LRLLPFITALVSIPPLFGAIHWAVTIEPSYHQDILEEKSDSDKADDEGLHLKGERSSLQMIWQFLTLITRITSICLLAFVYHEHWLEVGWSSIRIAVVETIPYIVVLLLGNVALQLVYKFGSVPEGLLGVLMPNGYLKVKVYIFSSKARCLRVSKTEHYGHMDCSSTERRRFFAGRRFHVLAI
jgi:hypothetical protein